MARATLDQLPAWATALLERERIGHLGVLDARARPRVLPVTYAVCEGAVWTVVDNKPKQQQADELARIRWLRDRPGAALTVDHYEDDWAALAWVQLVGEVAILELGDGAAALDQLTRRYPQYSEDPPPGPLLRLAPEHVVWWQAQERSPGRPGS